MNTVDKLNNVLGWLTAMNFDKPELSNDLEEPLNVLSEAISEVENLSLSGVVGQSEQLVCKGKCDHGYNDEFGNELFCSIKEKIAN